MRSFSMISCSSFCFSKDSRTTLQLMWKGPTNIVSGTSCDRTLCSSLHFVTSFAILLDDTSSAFWRASMSPWTSWARIDSYGVTVLRYWPTAAIVFSSAAQVASRSASTSSRADCAMFSMGEWLQNSLSMIKGSIVRICWMEVVTWLKILARLGTKFSSGVP